MKLPFLVTGLILIFVASFLMVYSGTPSREGFMNPGMMMKKKADGFADYLLSEAGARVANISRWVHLTV